jgi:hypothetical protein
MARPGIHRPSGRRPMGDWHGSGRCFGGSAAMSWAFGESSAHGRLITRIAVSVETYAVSSFGGARSVRCSGR